MNEPWTVPFGARTVVTDHVVHERVVEHTEVFEAVYQAAHVVIGVFEEARVDLHLPRQDGLQVVGDVVPGWNLVMAWCQLALGRNDPEPF